MLVSLIDLPFFRSIASPFYGKKGRHCYDPSSILSLDIWRVSVESLPSSARSFTTRQVPEIRQMTRFSS